MYMAMSLQCISYSFLRNPFAWVLYLGSYKLGRSPNLWAAIFFVEREWLWVMFGQTEFRAFWFWDCSSCRLPPPYAPYTGKNRLDPALDTFRVTVAKNLDPKSCALSRLVPVDDICMYHAIAS